MGIDITLHARGLRRNTGPESPQQRAFLDATRELPTDSPEWRTAAHARAVADAAEGWMHSGYGEDSLFGIVDSAFGLDSMTFLFTFEEGKRTPIDGSELLSKVQFLQAVRARLATGSTLPIFDELLDVLLDSSEPWAQAEAPYLAAQRRRQLERANRQAATSRSATAAFLVQVDLRLAQLLAFAELAYRLHRKGARVRLSVSM